MQDIVRAEAVDRIVFFLMGVVGPLSFFGLTTPVLLLLSPSWWRVLGVIFAVVAILIFIGNSYICARRALLGTGPSHFPLGLSLSGGASVVLLVGPQPNPLELFCVVIVVVADFWGQSALGDLIAGHWRRSL
jgi:hypothetical protein